MKRIVLILLSVTMCFQFIACDKAVTDDYDDNYEPQQELTPDGDESCESTNANISVRETDDEKTDSTGIGGATYCIHTVVHNGVDYDHSYHSIDSTLINYVNYQFGDDAFDTWVKEKRVEIVPAPNDNYKSCTNVTIVDLVEDFSIPREVFEALNDNYLAAGYDYNLDTIYAGKDVAEVYYTSDRLQTVLEKEVLRFFKGKLVLYVNEQDHNAFNSWVESKKSTEWGFSEATKSHKEIAGFGYSDEFKGRQCQYSYAELIHTFNIPKEVVEEAFAAVSQNPAFKGKLNIDALYSGIKSGSAIASADGTPKNPNDIDRSFIDYPSN